MMNKYIEFQPNLDLCKNKTMIWSVVNKKSKHILGYIRWYPWWRGYCFFTESERVLSPSCMVEISKFCVDHKNTRVAYVSTQKTWRDEVEK